MATLTYAGIGSRKTPASVLADITVIAGWLARTGWHLASGGATGADTAPWKPKSTAGPENDAFRCTIALPLKSSRPGAPECTGHQDTFDNAAVANSFVVQRYAGAGLESDR